jgi:hypothetical protein
MGVSTPEDLTKYGLACFGHLGAAGAHSYHEVMTVVALAGGQYTPGDYKIALTMIPEADRKRLMADPRFAEHLGGGAPASASAAAPGKKNT